MHEKIAISTYNTQPEVHTHFHFPENIIIYDSTLRDGEQMPGVSYTPEQKLTIARILDDIGVPEIEAGFPAISPAEEATVKKIAHEQLDAKILVLSRLKQEDIDAARRSDADIVLLFIATSPLHLRYKLHLTENQIITKIIESIDYAQNHGITPSFSTEDSTRTPIHFLEHIIPLAVNAGAKRIGFTDTVGCATPQTIHYLFTTMRNSVATPFSAHLHNDFGLALPNALAALHAGANHICTTINGWGERAGNVPLEQLVMTLQILYKKNLGIDTTRLKELSELVSMYTKTPIPKNHPLIGDNAFTHESGIHVAALLEHPRTYEPIAPELVGNTRHLVIGKHTGRHMIQKLLYEQGITVSEDTLAVLTQEVKKYGEQNRVLTTSDIYQMATRITQQKQVE